MTAIGQPASALIKALALRGRPHKTLRPNSSVSWAERASSWVTNVAGRAGGRGWLPQGHEPAGVEPGSGRVHSLTNRLKLVVLSDGDALLLRG